MQANDRKATFGVPEASRGCSGNPNGTLNLGNAGATGRRVSQAGISRRRKAKRSCLPCQQAHRTCGQLHFFIGDFVLFSCSTITITKANNIRAGDERPCNACIERGTGHMCIDGIRKKPKYLEDSPGISLMEISPSFNYNDDTTVPTILQPTAKPGGRSSLLHASLVGHTTNEICPRQDTQSFYGSSEEDKSTMNPKNPGDWSSVVPGSRSSEGPASWNILDRRNAVVECDLQAESDALNAENQLGFAVETGWSSTFF